MDVLTGLGLAAAAFAAGAINAVAGGGSLVSFPALLAAGYPSKTANVTNTVALWPGYLGGVVGYRAELRGQGGRARRALLPAILGAIAGSAILLATPESAFDAIVPFLIVFACVLLAAQEPLARLAQRHRIGAATDEDFPWPVYLTIFAMAIYGAYFGAGLGIMMLAALSILLPDALHRSNALKGLQSFVINGVAVIYFALFGPVEWLPCLVMAAGSAAGGYYGVGFAKRLGPRWLKLAVVTYGLIVAGVLFAR